jgi:drug/metabolite transporter (DMT)-like permease
MFSAVGYACYNVCLRGVSVDCDPVWVNCVQASVSVAGIGPLLILMALRGRRALPPWRDLAALAALGLVTQIGGVLFVFGLGSVGLAITAPLQTGIVLLGSVVLGRILLAERATRRSIMACVLITISVVFFGMGADEASKAIQQQALSESHTVSGDTSAAPTTRDVWIALGAACLSGVAFTVLTVGIRKMVTSTTAPEAVVFIISAMGLIGLGPWAWQRHGLDGLLQTTPRDLGVMLAAGTFNLVSFTLITLGFKLTSLVRINAINSVTTTALTAIAGIVFFAEPATAAVLIGIVLTIAGILLVGFADEPSPAKDIPS